MLSSKRTLGPRVVLTRSVTARAPTKADIRAVSPRSSDAPCCKTDGTTFMPNGMPPAPPPPPPNMMAGVQEQKQWGGRGEEGGVRRENDRGTVRPSRTDGNVGVAPQRRSCRPRLPLPLRLGRSESGSTLMLACAYKYVCHVFQLFTNTNMFSLGVKVSVLNVAVGKQLSASVHVAGVLWYCTAGAGLKWSTAPCKGGMGGCAGGEAVVEMGGLKEGRGWTRSQWRNPRHSSRDLRRPCPCTCPPVLHSPYSPYLPVAADTSSRPPY